MSSVVVCLSAAFTTWPDSATLMPEARSCSSIARACSMPGTEVSVPFSASRIWSSRASMISLGTEKVVMSPSVWAPTMLTTGTRSSFGRLPTSIMGSWRSSRAGSIGRMLSPRPAVSWP